MILLLGFWLLFSLLFCNAAAFWNSAPILLSIARRSALYESSLQEDIMQLMEKHDPILLFASRLLPRDVSSDASALYAWCRRLDEITDDSNACLSDIQDRLVDWEDRFDKLWDGNPVDTMDAALLECLQRNKEQLGREPFVDMMAGMKADAVENRRICNMEELEIYAYQVAGTVGLMLLPLLKANMETAKNPAISLGKAIQLINILRDASPDAALGRIYLPQDMLRENNVKEDDIFLLQSKPGYCRVVKSVSERAHQLLSEAEAGRSTLPGVLGPFFVQIIVELYRGYLEKLETMDYNNLSIGGERVRISTYQKVTASVKAISTLLFAPNSSL